MISDTLSDASAEIKRYQADMPECYDEIRDIIDEVTSAMDKLRYLLDSAKAAPELLEALLYAQRRLAKQGQEYEIIDDAITQATT
jgi:DNA repair ATPase RecN